MAQLATRPLQDDLPFGERISGLNWDTLRDEEVRQQILEIFEDRGMIVFEGVDCSTELQVELSNLFGPMEDHPFKANKRVDADSLPGVIDMDVPVEDACIVDMDGEILSTWSPWHFDNAYTKKLCRAGVLRALVITPEGGRTGFADGIQLYKAISSELRENLEGKRIIYDPHFLLSELKFGMPEQWRFVKLAAHSAQMLEQTKGLPRSVHPIIWTRKTGERVFHLSLQNAAGIYGMETAEGDALLEEALREMKEKMTPYWHSWSPTDMMIWDNWRFVHTVSGHPPQYPRRMIRTTIKGDYGLGRFEDELSANSQPQPAE